MTAPAASVSASILVASCDAYRDLWKPFFSLLQRHWPDCPYPIFLGSNRTSYQDERVKPLLVGDDVSWSSSTRLMLARLQTPYVLMLLDDFLLLERVETAELEGLLASLVRLDGAYLRLRPFPRPDVRLARFPMIGEIDIGAPYRASLQAAFWHRESLLELLRDEEDPWQMEARGARRSDLMARGFYSTWHPALAYYAAVTRGKWTPYGVAVCREQGVAVDLETRPVMTPKEATARNFGRVLHETMEAIPWRARRRMGRWLRATGLRKPSSA